MLVLAWLRSVLTLSAHGPRSVELKVHSLGNPLLSKLRLPKQITVSRNH